MRRCVLNDCNCNSPEPAPCCLDCPERGRCPDRCLKSETTFCVGVIDIDKDKSRTIKEEPTIH